MRALIFVGLKLGELAVLVFAPWGVGLLVKPLMPEDSLVQNVPWAVGLVIIATGAFVLLLALAAIYENWDRAGRLAARLRRRR